MEKEIKALIDELTQDMVGVNSFSHGFSIMHPTNRYEIELDGYSFNRERLDKILPLINDVRNRASVTLTITYD